MTSKFNIPLKLTAMALACIAFTGATQAAEGFKVRYPSAGTLGPELAIFNLESRVYGSIQINSTQITQITGNDGKQAWTPPTTTAKGVVQTALADFKQQQTVAQMLIGYVTPADYGGGHLSFTINVPYTINMDRTLSFPQISATAANGVATTPGAAYVAGLGAQAAANTTSVKGFGDTDVNVAWSAVRGNLKTTASVSLVLPTGSFNSLSTGAAGTPAINLGAGHFYTVRPAGAVAYKVNEDFTVGARVGLGLNTTNSVDNWKSGNYATMDLAAAYKTPIGLFGPQLIVVKQYQDDHGGMSGDQAGGYGANRYKSVGFGLFYATRIRDYGVNVGYTTTISSANALSSNVFQVRLSKAF